MSITKTFSVFDHLSIYLVISSILIMWVPGSTASLLALGFGVVLVLAQVGSLNLTTDGLIRFRRSALQICSGFLVSALLLSLGNARLKTLDFIVEGPSSDDASYRSISAYLLNHSWSFWQLPAPGRLHETWAATHWNGGLRIGDGLIRLPVSIFLKDVHSSHQLMIYKFFVLALLIFSLIQLSAKINKKISGLNRWYFGFLLGIGLAGNSLLAGLFALNSIAPLTVIPFLLSFLVDGKFGRLAQSSLLTMVRLSALITVYPEVGLVAMLGWYGFVIWRNGVRLTKALGLIAGTLTLSINTFGLWLWKIVIDGALIGGFVSPISAMTPLFTVYSLFGGLPKEYIDLFGSGSATLKTLDFLALAALSISGLVVATLFRQRKALVCISLGAIGVILGCTLVTNLGVQEYGIFRLWSIGFTCFAAIATLLLLNLITNVAYAPLVSRRRRLTSLLFALAFFSIQIVNQQTDRYSRASALQERRVDSPTREVGSFLEEKERVTLAIREFREEQEILLAINSLETCRLVGGAFYTSIPSCDAPSDGFLVGDNIMFSSGHFGDLGGDRFRVLDLSDDGVAYAVPTGGTETLVANHPEWRDSLRGSSRIELLVGGKAQIDICFEREDADPMFIQQHLVNRRTITSEIRELRIGSVGHVILTVESDVESRPYLLVVMFDEPHLPIQCEKVIR